jgi:DNA processing protein
MSEGKLAALAALPGMSSRRLGHLLDERSPADAWALVIEGKGTPPAVPQEHRSQWATGLAGVDLDQVAARLAALSCRVTSWHDDDHPPALRNDIDPAPVLFRRGELPEAATPTVGIVGTRRCSGPGKEIAFELGASLSAAGVSVVSGLALGVDGAAHRGAVAAGGARPVAVVGSGIDVVYPARHRELWARVASVGSVCTEAPIGADPEPWRFPARNRLIAAMSDLIVVVESRSAGGSLLTVDEAVRRGIDVMAVPGSVKNGAADGTNQLLVDGCAPVRSADDVLMALGLATIDSATRRSGGRPAPSGRTGVVFAAIDDGPTSVDEIVQFSGLELGVVYLALERLMTSGHIVADGVRVRRS